MVYEIYRVYWEREVKGKARLKEEEEKAMSESLKNLLKFLRDFEVVPDTLTAKQGFLIWYTLTQYHD